MSDHYQVDRNPLTEKIFSSPNQSAKIVKYVALGDSLTAGAGAKQSSESFPFVLAQKLSADDSIEYLNLGIPGATTKDVINLELPRAIDQKPDLITVLIGTNDIHNFTGKNRFKNELSFLIQELKNKTKARIILINIPYLGTSQVVLPPYGLYFQAKTKEFNKIISQVSATKDIEMIDLYTPNFGFSQTQDFYSPDFFHPDKVGYALWANLVYENIHK
jgi:lysophospholipase L1-like esterase